MKTNKVLDKPIKILKKYAPTNAKDKRPWLKRLRREIGKDTGYKVIAGGFNFTMNPARQ